MAITASNAQSSKTSINLRIDDRSRQLIDDAAQSLGKTRTDFMVETARSLAIDVLLDRRLIALEDDQHAAFVTALDNPPAPGPRLRSLLRRKPVWDR